MQPSVSPEALAVLDARDGRVLEAKNENLTALPGSTVKPFIPAHGVFPCPGKLTISGHRLDCTHPKVYGPVNGIDALALSCNNYFAHLALRLKPEVLQKSLREFNARLASTDEQRQLQALGYWGVSTSALTLARAYRRLLLNTPPPGFTGKTGTTRDAAWYAGWAPAENPRIVVAVMTGGRGIVDAYPAARAIFEKWLRSLR